MESKRSTKKRVLITIDESLHRVLKRSNKCVSTHINEIMSKYLLCKVPVTLDIDEVSNPRSLKSCPFGIVGSNPAVGVLLLYLKIINGKKT